MSTDNSELDAEDTCARASGGSNRVGNIDLDMKYPNVEYQENHREQHEEEYKKRSCQLRDKELFEQPQNSYLGECPICFLPLSIKLSKSLLMSCCSKRICNGCAYANQKREDEAGLEHKCAFCREPAANSLEVARQLLMKRIKKNDPVAMNYMGNYREGDYGTAFEYLIKAVGLGNAEAHFNLSELYYKGKGVVKDTKKAVYHSEEAAIGGHPEARHNLGIDEWNNRRFEKARKHFIIAANLGNHSSLTFIKVLYAEGHARKEDYANALRAYQAAVGATKSEEREVAEAIKKGEVLFI